jgi:hypothetical protein
MATILTTTIATWSVFQTGNILNTMRTTEGVNALKKTGNILKRSGRWLPNGIKVMLAKNGIAKMLKNLFARSFTIGNIPAFAAAKNLLAKFRREHIFAANYALADTDANILEPLHPNVLSVEKNLQPQKQQPLIESEKHAQENAPEVYRLSVSGFGVYYANGVLVSNCDTLSDSIKIALIDGIIIGVVVKDSDRAHNEVINSMIAQNNRLNYLKSTRKWTM